MQIELGMDVVLGFVLTVFVGLLGILVPIFHKISTSLSSIDTTIDSKLETTNSTLERIERDLNNLTHIILRDEAVSQPTTSQQPNNHDKSSNTQSDVNFSNKSNKTGGTSGITTDIGGVSVGIKVYYRDRVTIIDIKPENISEKLAKVREGEQVERVSPFSASNQDLKPEIEKLARDVLGVKADVDFDDLSLSIILPYVDHDGIEEFRTELIELLKNEIEQ